MLSLYDTFGNYVRKQNNESNSCATIETLAVCDHQRNGTVTLKWWKETGTLFISHIFLDTYNNGNKNVLTDAVRALLENEDLLNKGLKMVKLVAVANSALIDKLVAKGWIHQDDNLYLCAG